MTDLRGCWLENIYYADCPSPEDGTSFLIKLAIFLGFVIISVFLLLLFHTIQKRKDQLRNEALERYKNNNLMRRLIIITNSENPIAAIAAVALLIFIWTITKFGLF